MRGSYSFDFACSMSRSHSEGLISMWDTSLFVKSNLWCDDNFIIVQGKWYHSDATFFMVNVYGPQESSAKSSLWQRLHEFITNNQGCYVICGDFNEVSTESERYGSIFSHSEAQTFNSFIENSGLIKIHMGGRLYTWMNKAGSKLSKLDRFLLSHNVTTACLDLKAIVLDRLWSDHNPIHLHVKRRHQSIHGILSDGEWIANPFTIKDEFYKFYKSKFKYVDSSFDVNLNPGLATLSLEDVSMLEQHATSNEIRKAVWDCGSGKSPRHDGFSFLFIKTYWDLFKDDIVNFVNHFMKSGTMPKCTNSAFIMLIPKIPNPFLIKDYRPISLIGMQYKIIAKLLANRISTVIDKLVSPTQSTFISGRQILDGPLMVSEIIDWYKKRNKRLMIFKVDFEKAFDSVSWNYLDYILSQMGFGNLWRSLIRACLNSSCTSILVNGSPTPEFSLERGLRQRDPLSPFLFILIMEGLHLILENDRHAKRIKGATRDTLDLQQITISLNSFYCASGCQASSFPITCLSLPIGKSMHYLSSWNILIDKFKSRLSKWKASLLSNGGRFSLIKYVLGSLEAGFDGKCYASSGLWSSIVGTYNYLHSYNILPKDSLKCHLGNGITIRFSKDLCLRDEPLCSRYNCLFRLDINENCLLSERYNEGRWNWQWLRPIAPGRTEAMLQSLLIDLAKATLYSSPDQWKWLIGNDGTFSVASTRTHLDHLMLPSLATSTTWIPCLPRKVNIFLWRFNLDHLPHRLNLSKHDIYIDSILCPICNNHVESAEHIFFSCEVSAQIWCMVRNWCNITDSHPPAFTDWFSWVDNIAAS
ncbi:putative RNA-directed DNA polymerase, eukaryota, reverse transcriptase zinc-binding domain protein [Tanacetum coccineum]